MLQKFDLKPTTGIVAATALILVMGGSRIFQQWGDLSLWSDPGLFAALLLGLVAAAALIVGSVKRRRLGQDIYPDMARRGPIIDLQADSEAGERADRQH